MDYSQPRMYTSVFDTTEKVLLDYSSSGRKLPYLLTLIYRRVPHVDKTHVVPELG